MDYREACALAMSHANPWFGTSIVPFDTALSWGPNPSVEFEAAGSTFVGRAIRTIRPEEELTRPCCECTADFVKKYAFLPRDAGNGTLTLLSEDAISTSLSDFADDVFASGHATNVTNLASMD
mmetsp:Transcript_39885/g.120045  ORF Transcript_39885/g.120045 Transcript_39885/m.120045 type:complete len:123 (-) Transcript_39885:841-1209(-)